MTGLSGSLENTIQKIEGGVFVLYQSLLAFVEKMGWSMNTGLLFLYFVGWVHCLLFTVVLPRLTKRLRQMWLESRKTCKHCLHFPDCSNLADLKERDLPMPLCCSDFERKRKKKV